MNINVKTIPHKEQRYDTVGDYWDDENDTEIRVSEEIGDDYAFLVAIHEFVEQYLCKKRGITEESITKFDEKFESLRIEGNMDEPGDDVNAPYAKEHCFATGIERLMCAELGINWKDYDNKCYSL